MARCIEIKRNHIDDLEYTLNKGFTPLAALLGICPIHTMQKLRCSYGRHSKAVIGIGLGKSSRLLPTSLKADEDASVNHQLGQIGSSTTGWEAWIASRSSANSGSGQVRPRRASAT